MDKLTLEQLSAYLPYELACEAHGVVIGIRYWIGWGVEFRDNTGLTVLPIEAVKPLLRPLSINFLTSIISHADDLEEVLLAIEEDNIEYIRHDLFTEIVKNHGDVYSLIPHGLAVKIREMNDGN